jgi:hypothetical protein
MAGEAGDQDAREWRRPSFEARLSGSHLRMRRF